MTSLNVSNVSKVVFTRPNLSIQHVWIQWCFSALVLLVFMVSPAWSTDYYVSTTGNDTNSGLTLDLPLQTIQKAVDRAVAGDTVYVRGGVYRQSVSMTKYAGAAGKMITVRGYNSEVPVIKGSDVVTGWTQYTSTIWKKTSWTVNSQQVFVDFNDAQPSAPLQQIGMPSSLYGAFEYPTPVGSGLSSMTPGSFYYDAGSSTMYVWLADGSNPNNHVMEASVRGKLFYMGQPYIYLKNFAFRHSNLSATAKQGIAVELSSNSVIDQFDIQYTDFAGLSMGYLQSNAQAINGNVSNNGDSGINGPGSYNFRVAGVKMNNNNYRKFNPLWHAGGLKATTKAYGVVEFNEVAGNYGSGVWFDYANSGSPIIVRNNYIHDNGPKEAAIFLEVSKNGLIYNNILANNARRGIFISGSDNNRVYNNTIYGTSVYSSIELGGMPRTGATLTNNSIINNIVSNGTTMYDMYIMPADGTTIVGNTSDYNDFYRTTGAIQLYSGGMMTSLASWRTATKQDMNSLNLNPVFLNTQPALPADYALQASSPLIDKATSLAQVPQDYAQSPRPAGAAYDIGAYENASSGTTTPTSPTSPTTPPPTTSGKDTISPTITISSPATDGAKVHNSVSIAASATDNVGVAGMSLYVDGVLKAQSTTGQISYTWNCSGVRLGSHYIWISARDAAQNLSKISRKVVVQ